MFDQKWLKRYMLQNRPNGEDGAAPQSTGSNNGPQQQPQQQPQPKVSDQQNSQRLSAEAQSRAPTTTIAPTPPRASATSEPGTEVGATYEVTCPRCSNVYMSDAHFCRKCGHKRGDASVVVPRAPAAGEANNALLPPSGRQQSYMTAPGQRGSQSPNYESPAMSPSPMGFASARQFGPPACVEKFSNSRRPGDVPPVGYSGAPMPPQSPPAPGGEASPALPAPWPMMGGGFFGPYGQFPYDANANMYNVWPSNVGSEGGLKNYVVLCKDDVEVRASPTYADDARIGHLLHPGQVVIVDERRMINGTWFLHLADGRGWVFETHKRLLVMTEVQEFERGLWHYSVVCEDDVETRISPTYSDDARTGIILGSGDCVAIDERCRVAGARFLKLADGRGWVFETRDRLLVFSEVRSKPQEARDFERGLWHYTVVCDDDVEIRAAPTYSDEARTGLMLHPGDCVAIDERCRVAAVWYLRLADGRGWVFESKDSRRVMMQLH